MAIQYLLPHVPLEDMRLAPVGARSAPLFTFGLLTLACTLASFAFACATPFAAFAVIAAGILPPSSALLVMLATWVANQVIGFGALHYPVDGNTIFWGITIGAAALAGTVAAASMLRLARNANTAAALGLALVAAFGAYESVLFATSLFLGSEGAFSAGVVGRIGVLNILWLIGLVVTSETVRLLNPNQRNQLAS